MGTGEEQVSETCPRSFFISSRCRRRAARPLVRLRQLRGRERGAVEDVVLARLDRAQPVAPQDLAQDRPRRRRSPAPLGLEAGHAAPLLERRARRAARAARRPPRARARGRGRAPGRTRRGRDRAPRATSPCRRRRSPARRQSGRSSADVARRRRRGRRRSARSAARSRRRGSCEAASRAAISSVDPPPMSTMIVPASSVRPAVTPRKVSAPPRRRTGAAS